ncbi:MAG: hypothetical protein U0228_32790 [Myxococcaceae bacterium]
MFLAAYLAVTLPVSLAQLPVDIRAGENKLTQLEIKPNNAGLTFDWSDTEETLRGTITPANPHVGEPVTVSATVGAINGPEFTSPVTFSIRPLAAMGSTNGQTVPRNDSRVWSATFTPEEIGDYRVEISWSSTHHKVVRGVFTVNEGGLPKWFSYVVGGGAIAIALAIGLWVLFGRKDDDAPPREPPPDAGTTP